ncbi:MAG: hypothetical protein QM594_06775 [Niabella sp.]
MKLYLFGILAIILSFSCSKRSAVRTECELPCEKNLMCTYEFRSIAVEVSDRSGNDVELDSFAVVRKIDHKAIVVNQQPIIPKAGRYVLFSDLNMNETSKCGEDFEFRGYKDEQLIASRTFNIAHNCCHIYLVSGNTKIVVED